MLLIHKSLQYMFFPQGGSAGTSPVPPRPPHPPESEDEDGLFSSEPASNRPIHMAAHGLYQEVKQVQL